MVDFQAAAGYVVAHGDDVDRARLSWLRSGLAPSDAVLDKAEAGQAARGGWPALWDSRVPSVDATCFRLGELDDLGALGRPAAQRAGLARLPPARGRHLGGGPVARGPRAVVGPPR